MFPTSTHKKHWFFESIDEIEATRRRANERFVERYCTDEVQPEVQKSFLSSDEERQLCRLVEETAQKFCQSFNPTFFPTVVYTGFVFFKRFYMNNSAMEYMAKNVMMSCLYLASKVDEFNVSIDEFVRNLKSGTPQSNAAVILSLEAPIMRQLRFHLIVHCPHRPMEGHFIEMKTLCPNIPSVESMRVGCEEFLFHSLLTDVCFLFTPAQIALAAMLQSGERVGFDIFNGYIAPVLCQGDAVKMEKLAMKLRECITIVSSVQTTSRETAAYLQTRTQQFMAIMDQMNAQREKRKSESIMMNDSKRMRSTESVDEEGTDSDDDD